MSISNSMIIAIEEIKSKLDKSKPFLDNITTAMKEAQNHWLITDEEEQFKCAAGALMFIGNDEQKEVIEQELKGLRTISAMQSGVAVDLEVMMKTMDPDKFFGLMKIWKNLKKPPEPKGGYVL